MAHERLVIAMDLDRIKSTPLGRAWLSVFVRRVWESMDPALRRRLLTAHDVGGRLVIDSRQEPHAARGCGDIVLALESLGLIAEDWRRFKRLTPLGVEIYLEGRRQARRGAKR